jgi:hypothetical protein
MGKTTLQFLVYFMSEALASSKRYYSQMEKICYDVVMSARKLHHYFVIRASSQTNPSMSSSTIEIHQEE